MRREMRRSLLGAVGLVVCGTVQLAAHPHKPGSSTDGHQPQAARAPDESRRAAAFHLDFFTDIARRCPLACQPRLITQSVLEHRFVSGAPDAPTLERLVSQRNELLDTLRKKLPWLSASWSSDRLAWDAPPGTLEVTERRPRYVVVEICNVTERVLQASVDAGTPDARVAHEIAPGASIPFLVAIQPTADRAQISVHGEQETRALELPVERVVAATLRVQLLDGESKRPVAGRVTVEPSDGRLRYAGPFVENRTFLEKPIVQLAPMRMVAVPFFYADGSCEVEVPPGRVQVRFERGFEHASIDQAVEVAAGERRDVTLASESLLDAKRSGWISGDTHIHWVTNAWNVDLPLADLALVQRAEGLRVANNLTLLHRNPDDAFVKPSQAPMGPVLRYCDSEYHLEMGEEYRNQNLYGHLCFLNLQGLVLPIGTGPQIAGDDSLDYPVNKTAILEAREQGGISIEAHGTGNNHELPLNAVHGLTDSLDQIDPEDYYRLLDCGFQLPLTNGSDHPARVAGCARAYVHIEGEFDYEKWIDGIRCGRTFTTSGPLVFLDVDGQGPGSVIVPDPDKRSQVRVRAISRFPLGRVQIVSNGEVLEEVETQARDATLECPLPLDTSRWVVARCSRNDRWNAIWDADVAHTGAIYSHPEGKPVFKPEAARAWISRMQSHARDTLTRGRFANASQRSEATRYVEESIRRYRRMIELHDQARLNDGFQDQKDRLLIQAGFASSRTHAPEFLAACEEATTIAELQKLVEPLTLLRIHINPESRVKISVGAALETVVQHRTARFLVEVHNEARVQSRLQLRAMDQAGTPAVPAEWCALRLVENLVSTSCLTGQEHEWKLMEFRCSKVGHREVHVEAEAGQGTQDLGFRALADFVVRGIPRSEARPLVQQASP